MGQNFQEQLFCQCCVGDIVRIKNSLKPEHLDTWDGDWKKGLREN